MRTEEVAALLLISMSANLPGGLSAQSQKIVPVVTQSVSVLSDDPNAFHAQTPALHVTLEQIQSAAGTFGDFTRYLQVLPGVAGNRDLSNEVLVRGGHPTENLFVVDGIEIPNINHFSLSGSTGGFTSMIDSSAVGSVDLRSDVYDASYSSRLSSLIQIQTLPPGERDRSGEFTVGISGAGGLYQQKLAHKGSLLVSAHRSIINLITNDIGINGVPTYINALAQLGWGPRPQDNFSLLSLSGNDSINIEPCPTDTFETTDVQTQYSSWRTTEGLVWDHIFSPRLTSKMTASTSITRQNIGQQLQTGYVGLSCKTEGVTSVYSENSRDDLSTLNYQMLRSVHGWLLSAGASGKLTSLNDRVEQPLGEQSPFSIDATFSDSIQMSRRFSTGQTATFLEAEGSLGARWRLLAGLRAESFAIDGRSALDPRLSVAYRLNQHQTLHGSWAISSQLPPTMDLLTYPTNHALRPVQVQQEAVGIRLLQANWGTLDVNAYDKRYNHEAVSTEYPELALNNMIDTLGQQFVWLPLTSKGAAAARGLELSARTQWQGRLRLLASATYSQSSYRALDGISRRSSYDVPLSASIMANLRLPHGFALNVRESASSGHLYTPFNMAASLAQNRGIYDLTQVNSQRGSIYTRLDPELQRQLRVGRGVLDLHGGAENILNRQNFLGYVWMKNCEANPLCGSYGGPVARLPQIGLYPAFSADYRF
jgi:hypothetical protein